jgi:N-acetylglutamate synthase-like GNAT family acetyltransferase
MSLVVRPFDPRDQAQARRIVLEGLGEHFGVIDQSLNPDLDDIYRSFTTAGNEFYVAENDAQIVGTVGLLFEVRTSRIVRMSVAHDYRRRGIAKALLERCIESTVSRGLTAIVAFSEPHWPDAVGFYVACGFEQFGRDEVDVHLGLLLDDA